MAPFGEPTREKIPPLFPSKVEKQPAPLPIETPSTNKNQFEDGAPVAPGSTTSYGDGKGYGTHAPENFKPTPRIKFDRWSDH